MKKILSAVVACLVGAALLAPSSALAAAKCAQANHPGGEWRSFGHDLQNTRWQDAKQVPTGDELMTRLPKWSLSVTEAGATGNLQSTPVVADGCLYAATNAGWVIAANADTGELVWAKSVSEEAGGLLAGMFSLTVQDGKVFGINGTNGAPAAVALDQFTGKLLWSTVVTKQEGSYSNASPVIIGDKFFMGISGPEDITKGIHPGGYAILDTDTGKLLARHYTIPERDQKRGQYGASLWGTAALDPKTGYLFDGTGQPANKAMEHSRTNAIIKIDFNKGSNFGEIVDEYHGDYDNRVDVDFGASPTLAKNKKGETIIIAQQKSGKLHGVYADTMEQAWWYKTSDALALGNTATGATDGKTFFVPGNTQSGTPAVNDLLFGADPVQKAPNPGYMYAFDVTTGAVKWQTPIAGGVEYHLVAGAGDVVYLVTTHGLVLGFNTADGTPVFARSLTTDAGDPCVNLSSGAIIARNTIYAVCDIGAAGSGAIIAY
jgi:outer membrane protein assembly factor BamB